MILHWLNQLELKRMEKKFQLRPPSAIQFWRLPVTWARFNTLMRKFSKSWSLYFMLEIWLVRPFLETWLVECSQEESTWLNPCVRVHDWILVLESSLWNFSNLILLPQLGGWKLGTRFLICLKLEVASLSSPSKSDICDPCKNKKKSNK